MSKTHTVLYMDKYQSKPAKAKAAISIASAKRKSIRVPVAGSEGWVNELVVFQKPSGSGGGTSVAFTVELLDSCIPHHNADNTLSEYESADNAAALANPELFRVVDTISAIAGAVAKLRTADYGYRYINSDQVTTTANEPYLYLVITPTSSSETTVWYVAITSSKEMS